MEKIVEIFVNNIKKIFKNYAIFLVILTLCFLPSIYALVNIKASWDPYSQEATSKLKIAVVNNDQGTNFNNKEINIGNMLVDELKNNKQLGWIFTDQNNADKLLNNEEIYAIVSVPNNFSQNLLSFTTNDITRAKINYEVNEKMNAIAPKITDKGAVSITDQVNLMVRDNINKIVLNLMEKLAQELNNNLPKIEELNSKIKAVIDEIPNIDEKLSSGENILNTGENILTTLENQLPNINNILSEIGMVSASINGFINTIEQSGNELVIMIKNDLLLLNDFYDNLINDFNTIIDKINNNENVDALIDQLSTKITTIIQKNNNIIKILENLNQIKPNQQISDAINQLNNFNDKLSNISNVLNEIKQNQNKDDVLNKINEIKNIIINVKDLNNSIINNYESQIKTPLLNILNGIQRVSIDVGNTTNTLKTQIPNIEKLINEILPLINNGKTDVKNLKDNLPLISEKLNLVYNNINLLINNQDFNNVLNLLMNDVSKRTEFITEPVKLEATTIYKMGNYGSAMSPFYSVLSLWVGMMLMLSILKVKTDQEEEKYKTYQLYFGKLLFFVTIAIIQAIIVAVGNLFLLGIYCTYPWLFVCGLIFTSIVFATIMYSLVFVFGNLGKVIGIVLLVLQVAGSGGTFPIQLTPEFFQNIYNYLPFTYAISLQREAIGGISNYILYRDIFILCIYIIISILIVFLLNNHVRKYVYNFEKLIEESDLSE